MFPFCWFLFRPMLPRKDQMAKVATLLADGPLLEAFHIAYTCQHSVQHHRFSSWSCPLSLHFLSIVILSSESPSRDQGPPNPYQFSTALSSPILSIISIFICFIFCLIESLYSSPSSHFKSLLNLTFLMANVSATCLLPYSVSASVSFFSSDSHLTFDSTVRPCV